MKIFKRLMAFSLALMMTFTLFACDGKETGEEKNSKVGLTVSSNTYEETLEKLYDAFEKTDVKGFIELTPEYQMQLIYNNSEKKVKDFLEIRLKFYEQKFGDNIKFEMDIINIRDMSSGEFNSVIDIYTHNNLETTDIEPGAIVEYNLTVKGDSGEQTDKMIAGIVKENGMLKVVSADPEKISEETNAAILTTMMQEPEISRIY